MAHEELRKGIRLTGRGFELWEFADFNGEKCSVQQSSLALSDEPGTSALWIGVDDARPLVLASKAAEVGVSTGETTGWVPYTVPEQVMLHTRMHLTRNGVERLVGVLQAWLDTGSLEVKNEERKD